MYPSPIKERFRQTVIDNFLAVALTFWREGKPARDAAGITIDIPQLRLPFAGQLTPDTQICILHELMIEFFSADYDKLTAMHLGRMIANNHPEIMPMFVNVMPSGYHYFVKQIITDPRTLEPKFLYHVILRAPTGPPLHIGAAKTINLAKVMSQHRDFKDQQSLGALN